MSRPFYCHADVLLPTPGREDEVVADEPEAVRR